MLRRDAEGLDVIFIVAGIRSGIDMESLGFTVSETGKVLVLRGGIARFVGWLGAALGVGVIARFVLSWLSCLGHDHLLFVGSGSSDSG